jgi:hypothetical protein
MQRVEELFLLKRVAEEKVTRTEEMTQKEHSKCCQRKDIRGEEGWREMVGGE